MMKSFSRLTFHLSHQKTNKFPFWLTAVRYDGLVITELPDHKRRFDLEGDIAALCGWCSDHVGVEGRDWCQRDLDLFFAREADARRVLTMTG